MEAGFLKMLSLSQLKPTQAQLTEQEPSAQAEVSSPDQFSWRLSQLAPVSQQEPFPLSLGCCPPSSTVFLSVKHNA